MTAVNPDPEFDGDEGHPQPRAEKLVRADAINEVLEWLRSTYDSSLIQRIADEIERALLPDGGYNATGPQADA